MPAIQDHGSSGGGRGGFPGLGFDPTPGNVEAVVAVTDAIRTARARLDECAPRLAEAIKVTDEWKGDAARDFHRYGDDLPKGMTAGAQSMYVTGTALTAWANHMSANQRQADALEAAAKQFKKDLKQAEGEVRDTASRAAYAHGADRAHAEHAAASARKEYDRLAGLFEEIINEAHRLEDRHLKTAKAVAAAVRGKLDDAFTPVQQGGAAPFFDEAAKVVDSVGNYGTKIAKAALTLDANTLAKHLDEILPGGRDVAKLFAMGAQLNPFAEGARGATVVAGVGTNLAAGQVKPFIEFGQFATGSAHSPRWWELGIDLALTKVPIKGVRGAVKGAVRGALFGATGKEIAKEAAQLGVHRGRGAVGGIAGVKQFKQVHEILEQRHAAGSLTEALDNKHTKDLLQKGAKALKGPDATAEELVRRHLATPEQLLHAGERQAIREYLAKAAQGVIPGPYGEAAGFVADPSVDRATDIAVKHGREHLKDDNKDKD